MQLIWIDYFILTVIVISMLISLWRGFVKEALSLVGWILAVFIGLKYMQILAMILQDKLQSLPPSINSILAFAILFILTLIVAALINNLVSKLVEKTGLTGTDRSIGMLFGIARGIVLIGILVLLAGFTAVPQDPWWKQSLLISHFQQIADILASFLPDDIAGRLKFI
ncbi:MAG: CvpA family protein [Gammaproteobacteria bacterium]|nr:CvpA family protein [Gammaproteobacteria bacterium]